MGDRRLTGRPWLTQARPITTLYPLPTSDLPGTRIFMCLTLAQGLTRPITPMGLASFRLIGASLAQAAGNPLSDPRSGPTLMRTVGQRLFLDLTPVISNAFGRRPGDHRLRGDGGARLGGPAHPWPTTRASRSAPGRRWR